MNRNRTRYRYDHVAWCYEALARVFSLGAIPRVKASQTAWMKPGQRALYVGVGAGEDAVMAARSGVRLSCLDLSSAMLTRLRRRLDREGLAAELIQSDILDHRPKEAYDVVVANFVLNVFAPAPMREVMHHLESLLAADGRLMIADFTPPPSHRVGRALFAAYYRPINVLAWGLRLCALHPIYDYAEEFASLGLRVVTRTSRPPESRGGVRRWPHLYECVVAERAAPGLGSG